LSEASIVLVGDFAVPSILACDLGNANLTDVPKPKKKCCSDKPRCQRCPIRMLAEGTLPKKYTVRKRRLVKVSKLNKLAA